MFNIDKLIQVCEACAADVFTNDRYVSYVTVLDIANQTHWYLPCHGWLTASEGNPVLLVVQPDTRWQWTYVTLAMFYLFC